MNSEQQKQAIEWAIERLELCQDQAFQSCECEECQQCGKMPDECTGTDCAKTCQCSSCDHCGNEAAITELRALLDAPVECRCKRYGKDNPHWPCPVHAAPGAQPHGDLLARFPEINFSNYGQQEVEALQAWAFEALDQIQAASLTDKQQRQAIELLNLADHALSHASLNSAGDVVEHTQDRRDHMRVQIIVFLKALDTLQLAAQVNQSDESATCAKSQVGQLDEPAAGPWIDGSPPAPWDDEWFLASTIYGHKIALKPLPEEYAYDFTTADGTYMMRASIKMWAQLSTSQYVPCYGRAKASVVMVDEGLEMDKAWGAKNGLECWGHEPTAKGLFEDGWHARAKLSGVKP